MRKSNVLSFAFLLLFVSSAAFAAETSSNGFSYKLQRGFVNALLGWSKVVTVPYEKSPQDANAWTTLGRGVYEAVGSTVAGVYNFVFSPTPLREMPYPGGGVFNLEN